MKFAQSVGCKVYMSVLHVPTSALYGPSKSILSSKLAKNIALQLTSLKLDILQTNFV